MRNMLHNYEKLKDLFEMIENNDENYTDLTEKLAEYTMTKAIYKFLVGREEEFMELLLAAVSYPNSLDLFLVSPRVGFMTVFLEIMLYCF